MSNKSSSVEAALNTLVKLMEVEFVHKDFTSDAFLDVDGPLNNVLPGAILRTLRELRLVTTLVRLIYRMV